MASDFWRAGPDETKPFCFSCQEENPRYPHYDARPWGCPYYGLVQGATNGCPRCGFVAACIATIKKHLGNYEIRDVHAYPSSNEFHFGDENGYVYLDVFTKDRNIGNLHTPFEIKKVHSRLPERTDSAETQETMRGWLRTCNESHELCQTKDAHDRLFRGPHRLIELRGESVVLREDIGNVQYACLSHCWGTDSSVTKTTEETLKTFMREIPTHNLPANFLDAIKICRSLGIDYLWIDSLCIIQDQDSKEDWNMQAAQMSDIYENAYITIAATRSADASGGCFSRRHPKYLAEPVPGYEGVFVSLEPPGLPVDFKDSLIKSNLPLLDRGWVYQEMRLSRRVLHFCDEQVVWTCQTSRFSEGKCDDWATPPVESHEDISYDYMPFGLPSKNPRLLWYRWVDEYSKLQLTYPDKDRMAALAGLAKRMQNYHDMGRYLSGLWETSLSVDLGWLTKRPAHGAPQESSTNDPGNIPKYPTWSWASVNAPIEWESWGALSLEPLARVRKIDYDADGPVHMGGVLKSSGSITIEAAVFDSSDLYPPTLHTSAPTKVNGIVIKSYKTDRTNQEHGMVMGGLIVVVSMSRARLVIGYAQALHVKPRTGDNTYERIGFVELDYRGYGRGGEDYDPFEDIIEPWDDLPLRKITIV